MTEYILIGAEGKEETVKDKSAIRTGQGLYHFPWNHKNLYVRKAVPDLELIINEEAGPQKKTPRMLKFIEGEVYLLTTSHLKKLSTSEIVRKKSPPATVIDFSESEKLKNIFSCVSEEPRFKKIIEESTTNACIEKTPAGLFIALFNYDNLKIKTTGSDAGGYLFRLDPHNASSIKQIPGFNPTGDLVSTGSTLLVACGSSLEQLLLPSLEKGVNLYDLEGNILSISHLQPHIVLTDNKEGYLHITNGISSGNKYQKGESFVYFRDNESRQYLPSEATSAALLSYQSISHPVRKVYAFFGCDDGKILVYQVQAEKMNYIKTVDFLSEKAKYQEAGKDNHIWNLESYPENTIHFTLRNMYVRIAVKNLVEPGDISSLNLDCFDSSKANELRPNYGIDRICQVPHQISCMEVITVP